MCGRFDLHELSKDWQEMLTVQQMQFMADYNINPSAKVLALLPEEGLKYLQWNLVPFWSKSPKLKYSLFNARIESLAEKKPSFREAFKQRHCLVGANSYFEWGLQPNGSKQPFNICLPDYDMFCFAGLWEHWQKDGNEIYSCTIITTSANDKMASIHNRQPVIVNPNNYDLWLDANQSADGMFALLNDDSAYDDIRFVAVSDYVNNPRHNSLECIRPV
jgi:putative SOS response-associated peptidase YedK